MLLPCFSLRPGWWLFVFKFCWLLLFVAATQEIASEMGWLHRMFGSCLKERTGNVCFMKNLAIHQDLRPEVWEHDCLQLLRAIFVWFMEKEGLATGGTNVENKCMESPHYIACQVLGFMLCFQCFGRWCQVKMITWNCMTYIAWEHGIAMMMMMTKIKCIGVSRHVIVLKRLATTCLWHTMHGTKNMEDNWIEVGRMTQHDTASHTLGLSCLKAHGIPWHDSPTTHPPEVGVTPLAGCGAGMLWGQRATCSNKTGGVWQQGLWANAPAGATQVKCRALLLGYPR